MTSPVRCNRCRTGVYDLGTVTVTARYADCSMWNTPCCGSLVDDRGETGWKTFKDYERIDPNRQDPWGVDIYGIMRHG
ncbi:hypothetical protein AB0J14_04965 [Micromonospora arborensis]|uniref:hypothetical protein n=1 Tax=Micromonospora arborensis TaxID=2116518 RepID=UPI00340E1647